MRKPLLYVLLLVVFILASFHETALAKGQSSNNLQQLIDRTPSGGTLNIPPGIYQAPIMITKPIKLKGERATIAHDGKGPALTVKSDQVYLEGIHIQAAHLSKKDPTILIQGKHNTLQQITIETSGSGIFLRQSQDNQIKQVVIRGLWDGTNEQSRLSQRGNGIDLLESHRNEISNCQISSMHDGIYLESSDDNRVVDNQVNRSRYGYHFMYSARPILEGNRGDQNVTGAMVMGADNATVVHNQFRKQSENVNSQGLLLFEVNHSLIRDNVMDGNRVGIYVEKSSDNKLVKNQVVRNFIGLQMKGSANNQIVQNDWLANVTQVESMDSSSNQVNHNYWDDFQGLSLSGTNESDLPYHISPFFLKLATRNPAYQMFFHAPGTVFLEGLLYTDQSQGMTDPAPLMKPSTAGMTDNDKGQTVTYSVFVSMLLFVSSCVLYLLFGRKTR
ncbi:right-handed parallel beta-helix repeat-containing protein [Brevibacillus ginsengisoli]|uniref:right-handed parallel beta-helix repeat-containing protein n=1 Tax=Brevibacillus ginsengisoli TaxID=363854 RepID=UPI003CE8FD93